MDLTAGGVVLQTICDSVSCGTGRCVDHGGFPACVCDAGSMAVEAEGGRDPVCVTAARISTGPGGTRVTAPLADLGAFDLDLALGADH